ncbi:MAG: hypothetical protein JKY98_05230 [Gammaproteobacteria bacterium]|nr:hypothetical protein [Gammaproteobacteria bacterium]
MRQISDDVAAMSTKQKSDLRELASRNYFKCGAGWKNKSRKLADNSANWFLAWGMARIKAYTTTRHFGDMIVLTKRGRAVLDVLNGQKPPMPHEVHEAAQ